MAEAWYISLFKNYAHQYDREIFTQGTKGECDFLEQEFQYNKNLNILDVGCGTGRHAIELTKRGYTITGIDLSQAQLKLAKEKVREAGLDIPFFQADARNLPFKNQFDIAIMLCEGGFPLMETDEENTKIMASVAGALKNEGIFIFTTLNGLFPLKHSLNEFYQSQGNGEQATYTSTQFEILSMRDHNTTSFTDDNQKEHSITSNERYYIPSEITSILKQLGFTAIEFFGAHLGAFSRKDLLSTEDFEMLVVAKKHCTDQLLVNRYTNLVKQQHIDDAYLIIITFLRSLQQKLVSKYPEAKVTDVYQGYLDMSYVAVITPQLQAHNLKLALVYVHADGCFQAWLSAKNRTIQRKYREYFRSKPIKSCMLVEQGPGVDAILQWDLLDAPNFNDQENMLLALMEITDSVLHEIHGTLNSKE
ncbi:class I SAM-dependent methyltransferase [uncultured Sphaerochaeta sp.]|uniref:class I SAM-dependent methyltransferase n=1 Tax=uncultured Sphaerochaeta sp. TaxID=886478 RepID=UPI002AA820AA|nr:class I SAM-dependent methyltransferase [uncultured Sphaerochaeta sp.]